MAMLEAISNKSEVLLDQMLASKILLMSFYGPYQSDGTRARLTTGPLAMTFGDPKWTAAKHELKVIIESVDVNVNDARRQMQLQGCPLMPDAVFFALTTRTPGRDVEFFAMAEHMRRMGSLEDFSVEDLTMTFDSFVGVLKSAEFTAASVLAALDYALLFVASASASASAIASARSTAVAAVAFSLGEDSATEAPVMNGTVYTEEEQRARHDRTGGSAKTDLTHRFVLVKDGHGNFAFAHSDFNNPFGSPSGRRSLASADEAGSLIDGLLALTRGQAGCEEGRVAAATVHAFYADVFGWNTTGRKEKDFSFRVLATVFGATGRAIADNLFLLL
jgi:hypothetical protein